MPCGLPPQRKQKTTLCVLQRMAVVLEPIAHPDIKAANFFCIFQEHLNAIGVASHNQPLKKPADFLHERQRKPGMLHQNMKPAFGIAYGILWLCPQACCSAIASACHETARIPYRRQNESTGVLHPAVSTGHQLTKQQSSVNLALQADFPFETLPMLKICQENSPQGILYIKTAVHECKQLNT